MRTKAYWDVDAWAICYGDKSYKGEVTSETDCKNRLYARTDTVLRYVQRIMGESQLSENQLVALTSLYYNVKNPKHVQWRITNGHTDQSVANAFRYYYLAGGVPMRGLQNRRIAESKLFLTQ